MLLVAVLLLSLAFIIITSVVYKLHPFLSLLGGALIYGLLTGMELSAIIKSINEGFGGLMGNIGLIILIGVMIGTFLERSGGALVLAQSVLKLIGERLVTLAMMISGYIISIPVFADSGFIIMNPLNKALSKKAGVSIAATTAALATGLLASHVMVPPTPGPVAAAGIVGANLGNVILWGLIISALTCIVCYVVIINFIAKIDLVNDVTKDHITIAPTEVTKDIRPFHAFLPIIIPIVLIIFGSIAGMAVDETASQNAWGAILGKPIIPMITFIGQPIIALIIGLMISFTLPKKFDREMLSSSGWIGQAVQDAAPILLITGAGGIFGKMLQNSGIGNLIVESMGQHNWGLLIPFFLAAALKTCQGSSTVALVTSASIMAPLMTPMGLDSEWLMTLTVLSIAAGSAVVSHVNDSFFWVITQMTGFTVTEGYKIQTGMTAVFGITAMIIIYVLSLVL